MLVCREQPGDEVFVTGTFDDWSKSTQLDKKDTGFEKTVALQKVDEKILYKVCPSRSPCHVDREDVRVSHANHVLTSGLVRS